MISTDKLDQRILNILGRKPLHPSAVSRELLVSRTTIGYRLSRLTNKGLLQKNAVGKKSIYSVVATKQNSKKHIQEYEGKHLIEAYEQLLKLPKKSIVIGIQGCGATLAEFKHLPESFIFEAHRVFKRKGIILKGVSNQKTLDTFNQIKKTLVRSHIGRSLGIKIIDDKRFNGNGEILATRSFVLLSNPEARRAVVIKEPGIVEVMYEILELLIDLLGENSASLDLNSYLEKTYQISSCTTQYFPTLE